MISPIELASLHAAAESLMSSTCTITRAGDPVTDADGKVTFPPTTVYSGPCRVRPVQAWGRLAVVAGEQITPETFQVSVPVTATGIRKNDRVTIDTSPDPDLVERPLYVRFTPAMGDAISARRLLCEETQD